MKLLQCTELKSTYSIHIDSILFDVRVKTGVLTRRRIHCVGNEDCDDQTVDGNDTGHDDGDQ